MGVEASELGAQDLVAQLSVPDVGIGFPKIRVPFWEGPSTRVIVFKCLGWSPHIYGNYQMQFAASVPDT